MITRFPPHPGYSYPQAKRSKTIALNNPIPMRFALSLLLFLPLADLRSSWNTLVEAERSFARTSITKGTKEAFLSVLSEDSVIFRPRAVAGRKWTQDNPAPMSQLSWAPEFADIASAGDLGYTTGPWELRRTAESPPEAFGHYVTMWRKQAKGEWKVEIDYGIGHERAARTEKVDAPPLPKNIGKPAAAAEIDRAKIAIAAADGSAPRSLATYFANDVRLYRNGSFPFIGKAGAQKRLAEMAGSLTCVLIDVKISSSADLGYTYGTAEIKPEDASKPVESSNYFRIWKKQRDGSWKIVLDLLNPV
jgi:ketosteroid isomerase-like protein